MHTHYPQGTPLHIKLKNGSTIEGKFKDHKSGFVILEDGTKIALKDVRSMSPRKLQMHDENTNPPLSNEPKPTIKWRI